MKNKIIAAILTLTLVFSSAFMLAGAQDIMLGDLNGDERVTAMDARIALRASASLEKLSDEQMLAADVNFDKKVNAIDARLILRAASQLEALPEMPTDENTSETTTQDAPSETTTQEPEPDTGVVVSEYPEVIDTFFSGKFYLDCSIEGSNDMTVKIATKGKNYEFSSELDGMNISIMYYNYKLHFKHINSKGEKIYTVFDDEAVDLIESMTGEKFDMNFDDILQNFEFASVEVTEDPVLTKGEYNGEECDVYTFKTESGSTAFSFIDDEIKCIANYTSEGVAKTIIHVNELTEKIPSTMITTKGFTQKNILAFMTALDPNA